MASLATNQAVNAADETRVLADARYALAVGKRQRLLTLAIVRAVDAAQRKIGALT